MIKIGNNTKIEMVNVAPSEMEKALDEGNIKVANQLANHSRT